MSALGTGYIAWAAVDNPRIKAVGGVVGYYRDVADLVRKDAAGFKAKVDQGVAARLHYEQTGDVLMIPAAATTGDAAMTLQETCDYYGNRAAHPNYRNEFAVMSREHFLPFDVQAAARALGSDGDGPLRKCPVTHLGAALFRQSCGSPNSFTG